VAKVLHRLTAVGIRSLTKPGRYSDGSNLYLNVTASGSKSWVFIYRFGSHQREMGLGSAATGAVTLAEARDKAAEYRKLLHAKIDPLDADRASKNSERGKTITFGSFADEYVKTQRPGWKNEKHAAQWEMTLGYAYCKGIRSKAIANIDVDDVLAVLKPIWQHVPETARRVRMRIERVLDAAKVRGLRTGDNPARWRGHLDHLLPKHAKSSKSHHAALPFEKLPEFMIRLGALNSVSAHALEFVILTVARTNEVLGATWQEFDLKNQVWNIPAERMKAGRDHRVPLSMAAMTVIEAMKGNDDRWVFPGLQSGQPLSNMALLMLLRGMGQSETVHGFRSTFTDWASECTDYPGEVVKMVKAHAIEDKTEAAYRRRDLFEKRRKLMEAWAEYANSARSKNDVTVMREAAPRSI
jgi:integrase